MKCPYFEEEIVRFCEAYPIRKEIPYKISNKNSLCTQGKYIKCSEFRKVSQKASDLEKCPFLKEIVLRYCGAYPIKKGIPYNISENISLCITDKFVECEEYKKNIKKGDEKMEKLRGDAKYFPPNFWKVCRPSLCPACPYEAMCMAASKMERDVKFIDGFMLINGLYYHDKHMWFELGRDETLRMGLDDFGKKILGEITAIEFPEKSSEIDMGELLLSIICGDREVKIKSPIAGRIKRTNKKLQDDVSLINEDTFRNWLVRYEPQDLENNLKTFFYAEDAEKWLERDVDRLRYRVESEVGVTVADGGAFVQTVDKIDEADWENLVKEFLPV